MCLLGTLSLQSGLRFRFLLRSLQAVIPVALTTLLFQAVIIKGPPIFAGLTWLTWWGLERGGVFAVRMVCVAMVFQLLASTTSPVRMCDALEKLLAPLRFVGMPVRELALVASISLRFVPILGMEADILSKAQIARGAELDHGPLWKRLQAFFSVLVPLLVRSFRYADELALAMEARGYRADAHRTRLYPMRFGRRDALAVACLALLIPLLLGLEHVI